MEPMQQILLIAIFIIAVRIVMAVIATQRGWGWRPWAVIFLEILLSIALPTLESVFAVASLLTLLFMCVNKRKVKSDGKFSSRG